MTRGGRPANHFELGMLQEVGGATAQNKLASRKWPAPAEKWPLSIEEAGRPACGGDRRQVCEWVASEEAVDMASERAFGKLAEEQTRQYIEKLRL